MTPGKGVHHQPQDVPLSLGGLEHWELGAKTVSGLSPDFRTGRASLKRHLVYMPAQVPKAASKVHRL